MNLVQLISNWIKLISLFSHKQYEFLMHTLQGNLMEQSQISARIYPQPLITNINEIISEVQQQEIVNTAIDISKKQMAKTNGFNLNLHIQQVSFKLLRNYGDKHDDELVKFHIDNFQILLNINYINNNNIIKVSISMQNMQLSDVFIDTVNNRVPQVFRELVSFENYSMNTNKNPLNIEFFMDQTNNNININVYLVFA